MDAASPKPVSTALGHLHDAAAQLLASHDPTGTRRALICLEAASDLSDLGVPPAPVPGLPAKLAIQRATDLLRSEPQAEMCGIGDRLLRELARGD